MNANLNAPQYKDENAAYAFVEAHLWPQGPVCPHCGNCDQGRIRKLAGKSTRPGVRKCNECRKQFTVKVGTIFEDSHVPMTHWLQAIYLMCSSKKASALGRFSACSRQHENCVVHRHRIRHAMAPNGFQDAWAALARLLRRMKPISPVRPRLASPRVSRSTRSLRPWCSRWSSVRQDSLHVSGSSQRAPSD